MKTHAVTGKQALSSLLITILVFFPIWLLEIFSTVFISGFIQLLNDVFVFDDAQYISYGKDVVLRKAYWVDSALNNTISTAIIAILFALIIYFSNRFLFKRININNHKIIALYSALLASVVINLSGLYATIEMLVRSYPIWG